MVSSKKFVRIHLGKTSRPPFPLPLYPCRPQGASFHPCVDAQRQGTARRLTAAYTTGMLHQLANSRCWTLRGWFSKDLGSLPSVILGMCGVSRLMAEREWPSLQPSHPRASASKKEERGLGENGPLTSPLAPGLRMAAVSCPIPALRQVLQL